MKNSRGVLRAADNISRHFTRMGSLVGAAGGTANGHMSPPDWSARDCPSAAERDVSPADTIELSPIPESSNSPELSAESMLSLREDVSLEVRLARDAARCGSSLSSAVSKQTTSHLYYLFWSILLVILTPRVSAASEVIQPSCLLPTPFF